MRDFSWHVFKETGDIEAYLLYKEMDALLSKGAASDDAAESDQAEFPEAEPT